MTRRSKRPRRDDATVAGRAGGRWRLRNWRLRTKLVAMLLIPAVAVLVLVALRAKADLDRANSFTESAERVRVETTVADVVHHLQRERDLTVRYVAQGRRGLATALREQRERVDAAIGRFDRILTASAPQLSPDAVESFERIADRLSVLTGLRYAGENTALPPEAVLRSYSEVISSVLDIGDQAVSDVADDALARSRLAANALARVKNQMSVKRAVVAQALAQDRLPESRERALLAAEAELDAARGDFMTFATPHQQRMYTDTVIGLVVDLGNGIVESVLTRAEAGADLTDLPADEWETSATYTVNLVKRVQDALFVQIQQRSDALAADARRSAGTDAGMVLGALLVAAILAVVITRSLLRPLRALRSSALDVAEHKLPAAVEDILTEEHPRPEDTATRAVEPVPVYTREELGEVARAFDAVHGEAVRLAGEQALLRENVNSMFVNLSRRSQDLVERQLTVLDRMEEHEQDPDILGGLFELDHLATRMRRNSENLLVLAGEDAGRPLPGSVAADEVIGAALSEVEHYKRIKVAVPPALSVRGDAAGDLIHVISELFENATAYSPEWEPVSVVSSVTTQREWRIDITDRGAGMPDTEIRRTNARLADPPEVDVEVSRRMGLYVVARLAKRHRISVRFAAAADLRGLTATVVVPADLVEFDVHTPTAGTPRSATKQIELSPVGSAPTEPMRVEPMPAEPVPPEAMPAEHGQPLPEEEPSPVEPPSAEPGPPEPPGRTRREEPAWEEPAWEPPEPAPSIGQVLLPRGPEPADPAGPGEQSWRTGVEPGVLPAWPTEDDDVPSDAPGASPRAALDDEVPTDRLPAYQAVLSKWFPDEEGPHPADVVRPSEQTDRLDAEQIRTAQPGRRGGSRFRGELPPPVSRSPEAVRERMASLQRGVRRGRHARTD